MRRKKLARFVGEKFLTDHASGTRYDSSPRSSALRSSRVRHRILDTFTPFSSDVSKAPGGRPSFRASQSFDPRPVEYTLVRCEYGLILSTFSGTFSSKLEHRRADELDTFSAKFLFVSRLFRKKQNKKKTSVSIIQFSASFGPAISTTAARLSR